MKYFLKNIVALCDLDKNYLAEASDFLSKQANLTATMTDDYRRLLDAKDIDAVVVDPVLEAPFAVRQLLERGAGQALGIIDRLAHQRLGLGDAIARQKLGELLLGDVAGRELGAQVARSHRIMGQRSIIEVDA